MTNRLFLWLQSHPRLARIGLVHRWMSRTIWRRLEADPEFVAGMAEAEADMAQGRWYQMTPDGEFHPNPDWPADGEQPTHD